MPGALTKVTKGRMFRKVDERLKSSKDQDLGGLKHGTPLVDLGSAGQTIDTNQEAGHLTGDWLGSWWTEFPHKEATLRAAYIQAHEIARAPLERTPPRPAKPIVTYWVTDQDYFEAFIADSPQQVTVLILTPKHPPRSAPQGSPILEDMWLVAPTERVAKVRENFPSTYPVPEPVEVVPGVQSQRVLSY